MTQPHDDLQRNDLQSNELQRNELLWTAYRYSAGELSAAESLVFEERLATDQSAREALASAVALSETVCAIERESVPSRPVAMPAKTTRRSWLQPAGWVIVAAAACLALTFVRRGPTPDDIDVAQPGLETAVKVEAVDAEAQLLLALLDGGNRVDGNRVDGHDEENSVLVPSLNSDSQQDELLRDEVVELALDVIQQGTDGDDSDLEDQNAAPDWILAAVVESKS